MVTFIALTNKSCKEYAELVADYYSDIVIIATAPQWQPYWDFVKEYVSEMKVERIIMIGEKNVREKTYQLRFPEDLTHYETLWYTPPNSKEW